MPALRTSVRCLASTVPRELEALWMRAIDARPNAVAFETRLYGGDGQERTGLPVRCAVARKRIVRGERLCVVPHSLVLSGQAADEQLRCLAHAAAARLPNGDPRSLPLRRYDEMAELLRAMPGAANPQLLASRDGLLATAVLYLYHSSRFRELVPRSPLAAWVRTMPRRQPPLGLLLAEHYDRGTDHTPLQRRLALGSLTAPLPPGADVKEAATELMVAAVEEKGLAEGLRTPRTEVVLTEAMLADFHAGRHTALTPRQFDAAVRHTMRHSGSAAVKRLTALEAELQHSVLAPLLRVLSPAFDEGGDAAVGEEARHPAAEEELESMRWAHFMLRSRAVNLRYRRGAAELALVPFLDRLNHSHTGANVTYVCRESPGGQGMSEVVVTAARNIRPGEELVLHYGHVGQRGCLFGDKAVSDRPATAGGDGDAHQGKRDAATRAVRAAEARQQREMFVDEDAAAEERCPAFSVSSGTVDATSGGGGSAARGSATKYPEAEAEAAREATWLWRYGFLRSEEERAYEASYQWSRSLRQRLAHLTDVRRKGAPGTFVVGVPEGLEHLREQRESLERERYGNTRVFPPQSV